MTTRIDQMFGDDAHLVRHAAGECGLAELDYVRQVVLSHCLQEAPPRRRRVSIAARLARAASAFVGRE